MLASVVIEYSVKSLNKVFDYKIPDDLVSIIKVGHKVIVPFGNKDVEGFVLKIHNDINNDLEYKYIKDEIIPFLIICIFFVVVIMAATGLSAQFFENIVNKKRKIK